MFSISEKRAIRKANNLNFKHSINHEACLSSNYYYVNDLLIIMSIKREILKLLEPSAKI